MYKNPLYFIVLLQLFVFSCREMKSKKAEEVSKVELSDIITKEAEGGFEICLASPVKPPSARELKFEIRFKNGEVVNSVNEKILATAIEAKRCFYVDVYYGSIHRRNLRNRDLEVRSILQSQWQKDSIQSLKVTVYESSFSDKIYGEKTFDTTYISRLK